MLPRLPKVLGFLIPVVAVSFVLAQPLEAGWKILFYDKDGRLTGVDGSVDRDGSVDQDGSVDRNDPIPVPGSQAVDPNSEDSALVRQLSQLPPGQRFEPGEIIISDPPEGFERRARQLGFTVIEKVSLRTLSVSVYRLRVPGSMRVPVAVNRLRRQFPGLTVDANHRFNPSAGERTPALLARSVMGWGKTSVQCGRGVRLGAIDGAVDIKHPALAGRNLEYRSFSSKKRRPGAIEHGTAIAAMMIGKQPWGGLLPAAVLKHANIFEINEQGRVTANVIGLLRAVDWVASKKVHVINLSVAGSANTVLDKALGKAHRKGFILVAAAGNGGPKAKPAYPAAYDYVIAVTAVDFNQKLYQFANRGSYVEFAAPGVDIWTAVPGGGRLQSGTSFAAPYVSVLIGLNAAKGGAKTSATARKGLMPRMLDLGPPGRDNLFGWGLVRQARDCSAQIAG